MGHYRNIAAVSVLALALAACGGPAEEEEVTTAEAQETAATESALEGDDTAAEGEEAGAAEGDVEAEEEADEAEPEPEPTPEPKAEPAPAPTPTQAAAPAGPPAAFTQCQVCHQVAPGQHGIGPSLAGVFGRRAGAAANFSYTEGMRNSGLTWNEANLNRYLSDPSGVVPGTTMAVGPMSAADRAAIIAYLKTL